LTADPYCSDVSRQEGASLAGSGSRADLWLLVEHRGRWGPDAVVANDLPEVVRRWMAAQLVALGGIGKERALLVRQDGAARTSTPVPPGHRCFLAVATERRQELYRFTVDGAERLAELDLASGLAAGALGEHREPAGLSLICTNGQRDRCCARRGAPTYAALAQRAGGSVWQSTHQGGHRFAATGLWLPEGVAFGFLEPGDAAPLVAARGRGAIHLPRFRGRTFHPAPVQAADALLRAELGVEALDAWALERVSRGETGSWSVALAGAAGQVEAVVEERHETVLAGCGPASRGPSEASGAPPNWKRSERFLLRSWRRG
jgi:hypothetical protein